MLTFFQSIIYSFRYALSGIFYMLKTQKTAKVHAFATIVVIATGFWLELSPRDWILIIFAILMVWIAELLNTSLENLFDLVEPSENALVKHGKDAAAGAVLLIVLISVVIGIFILGPPLLAKLVIS